MHFKLEEDSLVIEAGFLSQKEIQKHFLKNAASGLIFVEYFLKYSRNITAVHFILNPFLYSGITQYCPQMDVSAYINMFANEWKKKIT